MPSKINPEPYFFQWESCIPLASIDQKELIGVASFKHKKCGHLVRVTKSRIPPKICPWCDGDTVKESELEELLKKSGGVIL